MKSSRVWNHPAGIDTDNHWVKDNISGSTCQGDVKSRLAWGSFINDVTQVGEGGVLTFVTLDIKV